MTQTERMITAAVAMDVAAEEGEVSNAAALLMEIFSAFKDTDEIFEYIQQE